MNNGKNNIGIGLIVMGVFMLYGFLLIYLRDFAPGKEEWIANYSVGTHFESRLAHVHGNLFAFLNIVIGFLLLHFKAYLSYIKTISWLAIIGLMMPLGILAEIYLGASPFFVLLGAVSIIASVFLLASSIFRIKFQKSKQI